jgi:hypothetical protein
MNAVDCQAFVHVEKRCDSQALRLVAFDRKHQPQFAHCQRERYLWYFSRASQPWRDFRNRASTLGYFLQ